MSLIEGIGDEVTHFFIALFAVIIVYIAWWSTNISEQRQYRTVLLLDRRRRPTRSIVRVRIPRRLSNHTETVTISEGTSTNITPIPHEGSSETSELTGSTPQAPQAQPKPNIEQTQSNIEEQNSSDSSDSLEPRIENRLNNIEEVEERDIIETMDADTQNILRLRRLAHFEGSSGSVSGSNSEEYLPQTSQGLDSASNMESIDNGGIKTKSSNEAEVEQVVQKSSNDDANITIKLKYINDDIKIVDGRLDELLGDFKKRHFEQEINTNKIVRLIFNGQVLKQDRFTLQSCGLFDNCVVHCLIHQKRPSAADNQQSQETANASNSDLYRDPFVAITNLNNNNQGIDWDLGNFLFAMVSFILLAAWYFRYVYAHLYTVTATVGLIIITGVFSIVVVGTYFPDTEIPDSNARIRIARAERIEVQQQ